MIVDKSTHEIISFEAWEDDMHLEERAVQQWEYHVVVPNLFCMEWEEKEFLNRLGSDGWEFAGMHGVKMIFKRPVNGKPKP